MEAGRRSRICKAVWACVAAGTRYFRAPCSSRAQPRSGRLRGSRAPVGACRTGKAGRVSRAGQGPAARRLPQDLCAELDYRDEAHRVSGVEVTEAAGELRTTLRACGVAPEGCPRADADRTLAGAARSRARARVALQAHVLAVIAPRGDAPAPPATNARRGFYTAWEGQRAILSGAKYSCSSLRLSRRGLPSASAQRLERYGRLLARV